MFIFSMSWMSKLFVSKTLTDIDTQCSCVFVSFLFCTQMISTNWIMWPTYRDNQYIKYRTYTNSDCNRVSTGWPIRYVAVSVVKINKRLSGTTMYVSILHSQSMKSLNCMNYCLDWMSSSFARKNLIKGNKLRVAFIKKTF